MAKLFFFVCRVLFCIIQGSLKREKIRTFPKPLGWSTCRKWIPLKKWGRTPNIADLCFSSDACNFRKNRSRFPFLAKTLHVVEISAIWVILSQHCIFALNGQLGCWMMYLRVAECVSSM